MTQVPTVIVALGALLFIMALLGGGITLKEISLPAISSRLRIVLIPISLVMMALGVWLSIGTPMLPAAQSTGGPDSQAAVQPQSPSLASEPAGLRQSPQPTGTSPVSFVPYQSSGTLIYEEDFEDGFAIGWDTQWEPQMLIVQQADGNHVLLAENSEPVLTLPGGISDYVIEARVMRNMGDGGAAGLAVRWTPGEPGHQPRYFAYLDFSGGWLNLVEGDSTGNEVPAPDGLSVHAQVPFSQGTWYTLAIEARGSTISVYLNGQLVGSDDDDTLTSDHVGLWSNVVSSRPHEFYFDDIRVWSLR